MGCGSLNRLIKAIRSLAGLLCALELTGSAQTLAPALSLPVATTQTNRQAHFPMLAVPDEKGEPLPLFSPEAYRAEFRFLRNEFQKTDLTGPAVQTDGWTYNISQAEWPFLGFCYFGYACANFAKYDPVARDDALCAFGKIV